MPSSIKRKASYATESGGPAAEELGSSGEVPRVSTSISSAADELLALFASEQAKLTQAYVTSLKEIEEEYLHTKAESTQVVASAKSEVVRLKVDAAKGREVANLRISALEQELRRAKERELSILTELDALRLQNKNVLGALAAVGIEFVDGQLQFNSNAAAIVDNYVKEARKQEEDMMDTNTSPPRNDLQPLDPDQFFVGLKGLLNSANRRDP